MEEEKEKEKKQLCLSGGRKKKSFVLDSHIEILAGFLEWFRGYSN